MKLCHRMANYVNKPTHCSFIICETLETEINLYIELKQTIHIEFKRVVETCHKI